MAKQTAIERLKKTKEQWLIKPQLLEDYEITDFFNLIQSAITEAERESSVNFAEYLNAIYMRKYNGWINVYDSINTGERTTENIFNDWQKEHGGKL